MLNRCSALFHEGLEQKCRRDQGIMIVQGLETEKNPNGGGRMMEHQLEDVSWLDLQQTLKQSKLLVRVVSAGIDQKFRGLHRDDASVATEPVKVLSQIPNESFVRCVRRHWCE